MHISVLIPAYNEEKTIGPLIEKVLQSRFEPHQWDILVVDDGSIDQTIDIVKKYAPDVRLIEQPRNIGKGWALVKGFGFARGEVVIIQDADLEYDPSEYPKLLQPIVDDQADVVYGSRFMGSGPHRVLYFWHYIANKILTLLSNMITNLNLSDMETGSKVIRTSFLKKFTLQEKRFGIEPELTVKLAVTGARFYEVGVSYHGRTYQEGKKITWKDGFVAVWCIFSYGLWERFKRFL